MEKKSEEERKQALEYAQKYDIPIVLGVENGYKMELMRITETGLPEYNITHNLNSAKTINTQKLWPGGTTGLDLSGDGFLIGEWDAGLVRHTHQEFDDGAGGSRVTVQDTGGTHWHSTHVGGTIIAEGQINAAHGMAFEADLDTYQWTNDVSEMASAVASDDMILSNHSYGKVTGWSWHDDITDPWGNPGVFVWWGDVSISPTEDFRFGFYNDETARFDSLAYAAPEYLIVKSAGNDRNDDWNGNHWVNDGGWVWSNDARDPDGGATGYDCLAPKATAKNVLTVGSCQEITAGYSAPGDVVISDFSSWGPTDDGRIKPDIVADGDDVFSTDDDADDDYTNSPGTSMSTPAITGSIALLQSYYHQLHSSYMKAATAKALVINTANEAGSDDGPDYEFGWGLMDSEAATELITKDNNLDDLICENSLSNGETEEYYFYADGSEDINVTICWTDPAGTPVAAAIDPNNAMLVNDLDLKIYDISKTTYYPWSLDVNNPADAATNVGENNVDNVETVFIDNPAAGYYRVKIDHDGNIGSGQDYALVVSGMERVRTNTWDGSDNNNWHDADNWAFGSVPGASDDVVIPAGTPNDAWVYATDATCDDLTVESGATLRIFDEELTVDEMTISGQLTMDHNAGMLDVDNIDWESGSSANITAASSEIFVSGDWEFSSGANVQLNNGYVEFDGSAFSWITSKENNCYFNHVRSDKSNNYVAISATSTDTLRINGTLFQYAASNFVCFATITTVLENNFNNMDGHFEFYNGTVIFDGYPGTFKPNSDDFFNNLIIRADGAALSLDASYTDTLRINGNFVLDSGYFYPHSFQVEVGGNWTNNAGEANFGEASSRVLFNGSSHQYIIHSETFNILEVDCGAAVRVDDSGYIDPFTVTCSTYDWTSGGIDVLSGTFTALDLAGNGINGGFWLNPGGTINLHQDTGSWIDLNAYLWISGGTFNVYGGSFASFWPYSADAEIDMSGGVLDFHDNGINIYDSATYNLTEDITGGTIRTAYDFNGDRSDFTPTGGTIEMYGSNNAFLSMGEGSNFYDVEINKSAKNQNSNLSNRKFELVKQRDGTIMRRNRANLITTNTNLDINGDFTINNGIFTAPDTMYVSGNWTNNVGSSGFDEGTSRVIFDGSSIQYCYGDSFNILELNKPSSDLRIPSDSTVCSLYYWNSGEIQVEGGIFTANDLGQNGIYGEYTLTSGTLNLHQDASNWIDLNAELRITGGTMNVYGGSITSWWPYSADALIYMSGGVLDFHDNGININDNGSYNLTESISGGTIRTAYDFTGDRNDFTPTGGTVELYGSNDVNIGLSNGSYFHNVRVDKSSKQKEVDAAKNKYIIKQDRDGKILKFERTNIVTASNNSVINNNLYIDNGTFNLGGNKVNVADSIAIYDKLQMVSASDTLHGNRIIWFNGSSDNVTNGEIQFYSSWNFKDGTNANLGTGNTVRVVGENYWTSWFLNTDSDAAFGNLAIDRNPGGSGYTYLANYDTLRINGTMKIKAGNEFQTGAFEMIVNDTLDIEATALLEMNVDTANLINNSNFVLNGHLDVDEANVLINGQFELASTGKLSIDGGNFISNAPYSKDKAIQYLRGTLKLTDGLFEIQNNHIYLSNTFVDSVSGGTIKTGGSFVAGNPNSFQPTGGTVELSTKSGSCYIQCINGNYCHNLLINGLTTISLYDSIHVQNNFEIAQGALDTDSYKMYVGGDWTNNAGDSGFLEETGIVVLNGTAEADIKTDEVFYDLEIDKNHASWEDLELSNGIDVNVSNDLTIENGTLEMNTSSILDIDNDFVINPGGGLNAYGDTDLNIFVGGHWTNHNSYNNSWLGFYYGTSTVTFDGPNNQLINSSCAADTFYNVVVDKPGTDFRPIQNTVIFGDVLISNGNWNDNGINLTHNFLGDFTVENGCGYLNSAHNTTVFTGVSDQNIIFNIDSTSGYFYNLVVDKSAVKTRRKNHEGEQASLNYLSDKKDRYQIVNLLTNCAALADGNTTIEEGTLKLNGNYYNSTGNIAVNDGGKLELDANASLRINNNKTIDINNGGELEISGTPIDEAVITHTSGYYNLEIESGGTISARNALFEYMSANGVYVKDGAVVDTSNAFSNCRFRNGAAGGTLLTIDNAQTLNISSVEFPTNTWSGNYNAAKSLNQGHITFSGTIGGFSGPDYENDAYGLIDWSGFAPDLIITSVAWSDTSSLYAGDSLDVAVTVKNIGNANADNWFYLDWYYNQTSAPTPGEYGDEWFEFDSLNSGDSIVVSFTNLVSYQDTTWQSWFQLDTDQYITESDEGNNVWGPAMITWQPLPAVTNLIIQYNAGNIELNWSYSEPVDNFYIYRDTDPYFTPSYGTPYASVAGTTTNWSEAAAGTKYFYIVTGQRTEVVKKPITDNKKLKRKRITNSTIQH